MLKHKFYILPVLILLVCFAGCKTAPVTNQVSSLDLLDGNSGFYIAIPKAADAELVRRVIQNNTDGISEKDCEKILEHIDTIYCGLNRTKKTTEFQAAIDGTIPAQYLPRVLTRKNGWVKSEYKTEQSITYPVFVNKQIKVAAPSNANFCIGRDVEYMLDTYDELFINGGNNTALNEGVYRFLAGADSQIRFYANKPQSFLTVLTGTNLNLQLIEVAGAFEQDPEHPDQYILDLDFQFKNEKFLKSGKALLTLAFGLTATESATNSNELLISGIKIGKESLYKVLVL